MKRNLISKENFDSYESVRESGATNMLDIRKVGELSGLQREIIKDIIIHYTYLSKKFQTEE